MRKLFIVRKITPLIVLHIFVIPFFLISAYSNTIEVKPGLEWGRYLDNPQELDKLIENPDSGGGIEELLEFSEQKKSVEFRLQFLERLRGARPEDSSRVINHLIEKRRYQYVLGTILTDENINPANKTQLGIRAVEKINGSEGDSYVLRSFMQKALQIPKTEDEIKLAESVLDKIVELKEPDLLDDYLEVRAKFNPVLAAKEDNIYNTLKRKREMKSVKINKGKVGAQKVSEPLDESYDHIISLEKRRAEIDWDNLKESIKQIEEMRSVPEGSSNLDRVLKYHPEWRNILENPAQGIDELLAKQDESTLKRMIDIIEDDKFFTVLSEKLGKNNSRFNEEIVSYVFGPRRLPDYIIKNTLSQNQTNVTAGQKKYAYPDYAESYLRGGDPERIRTYIESVATQNYTSDIPLIDEKIIKAISPNDTELIEFYISKRMPIVASTKKVEVYEHLLNRLSKSPKGWEYFAKSILPNLKGPEMLQIHKRYLDLAYAQKNKEACKWYVENVTGKDYRALIKDAKRAQADSFDWDYEVRAKGDDWITRTGNWIQSCLSKILVK